MNVSDYMARRCFYCSRPRSEHAHFTTRDGVLRVLTVVNTYNKCEGFLDEIEGELCGNPLTNSVLGPTVESAIERWQSAEAEKTQ